MSASQQPMRSSARRLLVCSTNRASGGSNTFASTCWYSTRSKRSPAPPPLPLRRPRSFAMAPASASSGHWSDALTRYAKHPDPSSLPTTEVFHWDDQTITIHDGFEKAQYHFLVLPRIPFKRRKVDRGDDTNGTRPQQGPSKLQAAGGKLALGQTSNDGLVPASHLESISTLMRSPYANEVLGAMESAAQETSRRIRDLMPATSLPTTPPSTADTTWDIHAGFHAVPSMKTVHLHVISADLVSFRLKHKKHYISFHPTAGFWQPLGTVQDLVHAGKKALPMTDHQYEELLKGPLISLITQEKFKFMPDLKRHLEAEWIKDVRRRQDSRSSEPATSSAAGAEVSPLDKADEESVTESE